MCFVFQTVMKDSSLAVMVCVGLSTLCVTEWMTVVTIVMRKIVVSFSYYNVFILAFAFQEVHLNEAKYI